MQEKMIDQNKILCGKCTFWKQKRDTAWGNCYNSDFWEELPIVTNVRNSFGCRFFKEDTPENAGEHKKFMALDGFNTKPRSKPTDEEGR